MRRSSLQSEDKIMVAGRPKAPIDWDVVDKLLVAGCLGTEVAAHIGIHHDTFYDRCREEKKVSFTVYSFEKRSKGHSILRAAQFDEAVRKRNITMLIWLGKNCLLQVDKTGLEISGQSKISVINYSDIPIKPWVDNKKQIETVTVEPIDVAS